MHYPQWQVGDELPPLVKAPVTREQLAAYARASGDDNPIHLDDEAARAVGLPGVIAHGMLSMGFIGQYLTWLGGPECVRRLKVRFRAMVRPGDLLTCRAKVTGVRPQPHLRGVEVALQVWAENQEGEKVTAGEAELFLCGDGTLGGTAQPGPAGYRS